ncbi:hypothetical protein [Paludisphaera soli]|uniref:hypothetical protein n=1 Tax=Paludisphaera soli TaxID=2712865 RepID=UPI0013EE2C17|nr:hypothetical protein [Paludisphaera soli]
MADAPSAGLEPPPWLRPTRRGRLIVWPAPPADGDGASREAWAAARRERALRRAPHVLEEALRLVGAGFTLAAAWAAHYDGRTPCRRSWHLEAAMRTEGDVRTAFGGRALLNPMIVTGPGMAPGGGWLVHLEADALKDDP